MPAGSARQVADGPKEHLAKLLTSCLCWYRQSDREQAMVNRVGLALVAIMALAGTARAQQPDKQTIVVGYGTDAQTLEPDEINSRDTANIADHIWGSLYEIADDGQLTPYLADSYSESEDGTELTFKIHPGLTCHDGSKLTAQDVVYTFQRAKDPANHFTGSTPGFVLTSLGYKGAYAPDDQTAVIQLQKYNPIALGLITEVKILCKAPYEKMTRQEAAQHPVGSGPYRFVEWDRNDKIVLQKVPDFPLRHAFFDRIIWRVIPEDSTRTAELLAGNVDIVTSVVPDQIDAVNASGLARVEAVSGTRRMYVGFQQKPIFNTPGGLAIRKPEVRRALQYAVDVATICQQLLRTQCTREADLVNSPNDNPDLKPYPFDPATAEKLLDAAGYPRGKDGVRFTLTLQASTGRYLNDKNVVLAIAQYLSDVGVKTDVQFMDWASTYLPLTRRKEAGPLFFLGTGGGTWSALYDMADFSDPSAVTNAPSWDDPDWYSGWPELNRKQPEAQQRAVVNRMLKVFHDDGPWLLLYFQPDFYGVSNRINWQARRDERINLVTATLK
jgi:peptide/nickel transport system substrate-binding protein